MNPVGIELQSIIAVFGQQKRPVKVCYHHTLRHQRRRGHRQRRPDHAAHHHLVALAQRLFAQRQCLGQAAGFVQLDVDHIVLALQMRQAGPVVTAFIGTYRHGPVHPDQRLVLGCGQRLFHQGHAQAHQMRGQIGIDIRIPTFVRVDDDL